MAALSMVHSFPTKNNNNNTSSSSNQEVRSRRNCPRFLVLLACQGNNKPADTSTPQQQKTRKENKKLLSRNFFGLERFGKGLKENLSPQQKGDWKDLVLMSLSFAIYVYISQQIVGAYFAWMYMPQQSW
ncbi:hypothetical protein ACOSP7_018951 [Xanthoceras sorbifolium]|uniref:Uncharacterized protein n=1 Tax=Xanthoceras sorbifolium TaxID=99658 RepID=A0ABQ8I2J6_9ROSI|nr:hypothetical protein JRO89_XS05G0149000 [Xanthoceras sorbifolium]